jgi:NADH-quinone oxidoreductase subunit D
LDRTIQYQYSPGNLENSEPSFWKADDLEDGQTIVNLGPQHPSTHGVLRLEVKLDGEIVVEVDPHIGFLHRCFEKHAEALPFNQIIPYVDRMDYVAAINSEHVYAMAVEKWLGISDQISPRVEYIRILVAELNRIASHFVAIGTYGIDIGAFTPFLWLMRDREHIMRMLEWASGARMLYNYIWVGGLFYDLQIGFEERAAEFIHYLKPKLKELEDLLLNNTIFIERTANVGVLPRAMAINYGVTGPMLRGSGLKQDLRKTEGYSLYNNLEFDVPIGKGEMGKTGDCWDRTYVRVKECRESVKIISQCIEKLQNEFKRSQTFNPQAACPKKIRPAAGEYFFRGETPRGELAFYMEADGRSDIPMRLKARTPSFSNLSVLPAISKGCMLADLIAIIGSIDLIMGEVDR